MLMRRVERFANSGNVGAIQLLLDEGANVNTQGGGYGNALQAATYKGNLAAMQLLLNDQGVDVGAKGWKVWLCISSCCI